jgi:hypothetical protein
MMTLLYLFLQKQKLAQRYNSTYPLGASGDKESIYDDAVIMSLMVP